MTTKTLSLPVKAATAATPQPKQEVYIPTAEEVAAYHAQQRSVAPPSGNDWKYDAPVESRPFDLSRVPPSGARNSAPVQAPARVWGDPRLVPPDAAPAGPQPLFTPPRGR